MFQSLFIRLVAIVFLLISLPAIIILWIIHRWTLKGIFLFKQLRTGKDMKTFTLYKICTMIKEAEDLKSKIYHLNQADGPVFKIYNDPRYTPFGKFLSHTGLDELPQLINIIKGEMSFVGPRPLPVNEAQRVPKKYKKRFTVLPGITSLWVVRGSHRLKFRQWMELDLEYVNNQSLFLDISIALQTIAFMLKNFVRNILQ